MPVLVHDAWSILPPWRLPVSRVRAPRAARWGVPTFGEALDVLATTALSIAIDTKSADAAPSVLAALRERDLLGRALLWSQHEEAVRHYARHGDGAPEVALLRDAMSDDAEQRFLDDALAFGAGAVSVHQDRLTPGLVERCHAVELRVHCWFQDQQTQRAKARFGLDGIVTDWPVEARQAVADSAE